MGLDAGEKALATLGRHHAGVEAFGGCGAQGRRQIDTGPL